MNYPIYNNKIVNNINNAKPPVIDRFQQGPLPITLTQRIHQERLQGHLKIIIRTNPEIQKTRI
jgi:hypothetical protein